MAWTTPRTWTAGESPSAATLNTHIRDNLGWLYDPPACMIYRTSDGNWSSAASFSEVGNFTEDYDTDGIYTSGNKMVIVTSGRYLVTGVTRWVNGTDDTDQRGVNTQYSSNSGSSWNEISTAYAPAHATFDPTVFTQMEVDLTTGDWVHLQGMQNSGSTITLRGGSRYFTFLAVRMVAP